jgi:hypothetical protein
MTAAFARCSLTGVILRCTMTLRIASGGRRMTAFFARCSPQRGILLRPDRSEGRSVATKDLGPRARSFAALRMTASLFIGRPVLVILRSAATKDLGPRARSFASLRMTAFFWAMPPQRVILRSVATKDLGPRARSFASLRMTAFFARCSPSRGHPSVLSEVKKGAKRRRTSVSSEVLRFAQDDRGFCAMLSQPGSSCSVLSEGKRTTSDRERGPALRSG